MQLHFQTYGEGFPLIILHGLLGSLDNWQTLSRKISRHFKVFAVDQRNHGHSPHSEEFSYDLMAGDMEEFMLTHGLGSAHVLGHSMGGKTAMHFALTRPERVAKLVVVEMSPRESAASHAATLQALLALDLETAQNRSQLDVALAASVPEATLRQFLLKNLRRDTAGVFQWKVNLQGLLDHYNELNAALTTDRQFQKPTLFVRGEKSDYIGDPDLDQIHKMFPRAKVRTIAGAGHWVHADAPEVFMEIVLGFLNEPEGC